MAYTDFPSTVKILRPAFAPQYNTRPGPAATNGMQRSYSLAGTPFRLKFSVSITDQESARAMRAFFYKMEADKNLVRIALPDVYAIDGPFALDTVARRAAWPSGVPYSNGVYHISGAGHAVPTLDVALVGSATVDSPEIIVQDGTPPPAGCVISINDFCYGIAGSWEGDTAGTSRLQLSPPLRQDLSSGQRIDYAATFIGFCISDSPGYEPLSLGRYGEHALEFREDLTRLVEL